MHPAKKKHYEKLLSIYESRNNHKKVAFYKSKLGITGTPVVKDEPKPVKKKSSKKKSSPKSEPVDEVKKTEE